MVTTMNSVIKEILECSTAVLRSGRSNATEKLDIYFRSLLFKSELDRLQNIADGPTGLFCLSREKPILTSNLAFLRLTDLADFLAIAILKGQPVIDQVMDDADNLSPSKGRYGFVSVSDGGAEKGHWFWRCETVAWRQLAIHGGSHVLWGHLPDDFVEYVYSLVTKNFEKSEFNEARENERSSELGYYLDGFGSRWSEAMYLVMYRALMKGDIGTSLRAVFRLSRFILQNVPYKEGKFYHNFNQLRYVISIIRLLGEADEAAWMSHLKYVHNEILRAIEERNFRTFVFLLDYFEDYRFDFSAKLYEAHSDWILSELARLSEYWLLHYDKEFPPAQDPTDEHFDCDAYFEWDIMSCHNVYACPGVAFVMIRNALQTSAPDLVSDFRQRSAELLDPIISKSIVYKSINAASAVHWSKNHESPMVSGFQWWMSMRGSQTTVESALTSLESSPNLREYLMSLDILLWCSDFRDNVKLWWEHIRKVIEYHVLSDRTLGFSQARDDDYRESFGKANSFLGQNDILDLLFVFVGKYFPDFVIELMRDLHSVATNTPDMIASRWLYDQFVKLSFSSTYCLPEADLERQINRLLEIFPEYSHTTTRFPDTRDFYRHFFAISDSDLRSEIDLSAPGLADRIFSNPDKSWRIIKKLDPDLKMEVGLTTINDRLTCNRDI